MSGSDATEILRALDGAGVVATVGGGWAIDALLGRQTRDHGDLDLWLPAADLEPLIATMVAMGVDRLFPWGGDRPWNFVLHDGSTRRVDLHLYESLGGGSVHYGSAISGNAFPASALEGRGMIVGEAVRCETPEWSLRCHSGYEPRAVDHHDVALLCTAFALSVPATYRQSPSD